MKRNFLQKSWGTACIMLVLLACGASPSWAYDQDLKKLASDLAARMHAAKHARVTVVDFVDLDKKPSKLGNFLAQLLQMTLAAPELQLDVVDQSQLPQLFDQVALYDEGLIDPATGRDLGKVAGTEVLVLGTVMPSSMTIRLDIKAIDLQTAKVITGGSARLARLGLLDRLASESAGEGSDTGSVNGGGEAGAAAKAAPQNGKGKPPARSLRVQGVAFELGGCSLSGDGLTCAVTVTSEGRDRWFSLGFDTRAWNDVGDEYGASDVVIANTTAKASHDRCATKQILKNVQTPLSLTFSQFGDEAGFVERLRLVWSEHDRCWTDDWRTVDFEKIDFTEDPSSGSTKRRSGDGKGDAGSADKRPGGLLKRLGGKVVEGIEKAADKIIEEKTHGLIGGDGDDKDKDEDEDEDPPE